ncbi:MAG TPA: L,D-transpeptidase [Anaerolineae bacterium]|nr:L,D-transpeptidase [Anaerolineae bacterium]
MRRFMILCGGFFGLLLGLWVTTPATEAARCFSENDVFDLVCNNQDVVQNYTTPLPFEDSFLPNRTYARIEDNANVYAEPSFGAEIRRNVGDGFLYSTLHGAVRRDGELWYIMNGGEYIHSSQVRVTEISEFQGMLVRERPQRPFGWVVADFWPSWEPDGEPDQDYPKIRRYTFFEIYGVAQDDEGWLWYDIGEGRWMRQTFASIVEYNRRPEGVGEDEFWVEVDLYEQTLAAYEGDTMVFATLVSSGLNRWPTREGLFQVFERVPERKMSGAEGRVDYYFVEDVPHSLYFDEKMGIALHGAYWHDRFGYKHSHGCVNMPPLDSEWLFKWSENAPSALWVWVHTSSPTHYWERRGTDIPGA